MKDTPTLLPFALTLNEMAKAKFYCTGTIHTVSKQLSNHSICIFHCIVVKQYQVGMSELWCWEYAYDNSCIDIQNKKRYAKPNTHINNSFILLCKQI